MKVTPSNCESEGQSQKKMCKGVSEETFASQDDGRFKRRYRRPQTCTSELSKLSERR